MPNLQVLKWTNSQKKKKSVWKSSKGRNHFWLQSWYQFYPWEQNNMWSIWMAQRLSKIWRLIRKRKLDANMVLSNFCWLKCSFQTVLSKPHKVSWHCISVFCSSLISICGSGCFSLHTLFTFMEISDFGQIILLLCPFILFIMSCKLLLHSLYGCKKLGSQGFTFPKQYEPPQQRF